MLTYSIFHFLKFDQLQSCAEHSVQNILQKILAHSTANKFKMNVEGKDARDLSAVA